jgi:hypothetical protein
MDETPPPSTVPKRKGRAGDTPVPQEPGETQVPKKPRLAHDADADADTDHTIACQCNLVHKTIIVELEQRAATDAGAPLYAPDTIADVVEPDVCTRKRKELRCDHLSFDMFRLILEDTHSAYSLASNRLYYTVPDDDEEDEIEIEDEDDFRVSVGVLSQCAKAEEGYTLTMNLRPR